MAEDGKVMKSLIEQFLTQYMSHFPFEKAIENFPTDKINEQPPNSPFGFWELLEHIRRLFQDIVDYVFDENYEYIHSDNKYWPAKSNHPVSGTAWNQTIDEIRRLYSEVENLVKDENTVLTNELKYQKGTGHTYLRQLLMIIDHNSYHIGQFILMRKLLNIWQ